MQTYIGTKIIRAIPMTRAYYNGIRGWDVPADENPLDDGYLVEYLDGGKANLAGYDGYVSWSPKDVFERAYKPCTQMSFGDALVALKSGKKVARAGWNGKDMWLSLSCDQSRMVHADHFWSKNNADFARQQPEAMAEVLPSITMKTVNAHGRVAILMGWLASQTDMLSEDWLIVE